MVSKSRFIVLFLSVLTISCFAPSFINASVNAQDTKQPQTEQAASPQQSECPLGKSGNPSCKKTAGCASQSCCKQAQSCYHKTGCASAQGCNTPCRKRGGYGQSGGHRAADMIGLVHCAKKELMKEKIKAKLEAKMGAKLDKAADLLVDAMLEEYKAGRASKERRAEIEKKMIEIFAGKGGK